MGDKREGDLDGESVDEFCVYIDLIQDRFDRLLSELKYPDAQLGIDINTATFWNFYARWSPTISEGRVIKFLNRKSDVENHEEIPEDFFDEFPEDYLGNDNLLSIRVKRNTVVATLLEQAPLRVSEFEVDNEYGDASARTTQIIEQSSALNLQTTSIVGVEKAVRWYGKWIAFLLALLIMTAIKSS